MFIEKKTIKTPLDTTREYYYDHLKKTEYRRIIGGVSWPVGDTPGFVCVIAESEYKDRRLQIRHCYLLDEYENIYTERLIKKLYDLQTLYLVSPWYGEVDNVLMSHLVDVFNNKLNNNQKGIRITEAPFSDDPHNLMLYANQIKDRMLPAKKSLHFGDQSKIPSLLSELAPDVIYKQQAQSYPMAAALGFAIAGLSEPYVSSSKDRGYHEQYINRVAVEGV